jgi:uncharacterized protein (TIGR03067 family)
MARTWSLVCVLLPAAALAPAAPALKDKTPQEAPVVGEWVRVGHTEAGAPVPPDQQPHHQTFGTDGVWDYWYGARADNSGRKSFTTDAKQKPATIDIHMNPNGPPTWRGIYKVDGDTLTLCLVTGDRDRPKAFDSTADRPTTIWVFKRVKDKE